MHLVSQAKIGLHRYGYGAAVGWWFEESCKSATGIQSLIGLLREGPGAWKSIGWREKGYKGTR